MDESNTEKTLAEGFKLHRISLKDSETKHSLWSTKNDITKSKEEVQVHLSKDVTEKSDLLLEVVFSSVEPMKNFNLIKRFFFKNKCLEEWYVGFGEVKPKCAYTWQITLISSPDVTNMPFDVLSGHLTMDVKFCDEDIEFSSGLMKIYYEGQPQS